MKRRVAGNRRGAPESQGSDSFDSVFLPCSRWQSSLLLCQHRNRPSQSSFDPFLNKYCFECHTGDDPAGDVDFSVISRTGSLEESFEVWGKVDSLLREHRHASRRRRATERVAERTAFHRWYQKTFVDSVEARSGGPFRPRRLSATEYRNTMRSLFGFALEVNVMEAEQTITEKSLVLKLLPTDPPGNSGYRNDTHSNPLSTQIWEQYSYLTDFALDELFSGSRREALQSMAGEIAEEGFDRENAELLIRNFVPRAWRRPVELSRLHSMIDAVKGADDFKTETRRQLKTVLMSPQFIYRGLLIDGAPGKQQWVDQFELAERLSYFLWSDMPDAELTRLAEEGQLRSVLHAQVRRMLDSPKADNLATDFAVQWLDARRDRIGLEQPAVHGGPQEPADRLLPLSDRRRSAIDGVG